MPSSSMCSSARRSRSIERMATCRSVVPCAVCVPMSLSLLTGQLVEVLRQHRAATSASRGASPRPTSRRGSGSPLAPSTRATATTRRCPRAALAGGQEDEARAQPLEAVAVEVRQEVERRRDVEVVADRPVVEAAQVVGARTCERGANTSG